MNLSDFTIASLVVRRVAPVIIMAGMLLAGCVHPSDSYSSYHSFSPGQGWLYGDTITFAPTHYNSLATGSLVLAIRHDINYPYTDLWLEMTSCNVERKARRDTIHYRLVDRHGAWVGNGIGSSFQLTDTVPGIEHATGLPVSVRHIMRTDTLQGINQVGLFFVPN